MPGSFHGSRNAFTLMELSIVILILALLAGAAMRYVNVNNDTNFIATTNNTLDVVDTMLQNYRNMNGRLPCPADITQPENSSVFGTEVYQTTAGDGTCNNAAGTINYVNTSTDPDGPSGGDPSAPDPNFDSASVGQIVEGAIPTKTLKLPDRYAYDAWGNKIFYAVDKRATATAAFAYTNNAPFSLKNNGTYINPSIVIRTTMKAPVSSLANAITYYAMYALVSAGKDGHGAFVRNATSTSIRASAGSTNVDELTNCHCDTNAAATAFNRIFVQKPLAINVGNTSDNFDDIVRFKTRGDLVNSNELQ